MKAFVFSDSHLSDKYDPEFEKWVKHNSKGADKVIICGDFWDPAKCTWDEFCDSKWSETLFPYLKSKDTVFIYGNHDERRFLDKRVELFSNSQVAKYYLDIDGISYCFEHGHLQRGSIESIYPKLFDALKLRYFGSLLNDLMLSIFGNRYMKIFKTHVRHYGRVQSCVGYYVFGHVHCQKFCNKEKYICLGASGFGILNGVVINQNELHLLTGMNNHTIILDKE